MNIYFIDYIFSAYMANKLGGMQSSLLERCRDTDFLKNNRLSSVEL